MIHTDAFFRVEGGKILGYKSSAISTEDIKDGKYKPGCLVYWTSMEEVSDAITQMPKEGETSQFMALSIDISNDTCTIKGQEDAGMFFLPKDLTFKIGEPTSLDYIMDSANPETPFTFTPLGFYSTKEQIQNLRSKLNTDTGVIQKASEYPLANIFDDKSEMKGGFDDVAHLFEGESYVVQFINDEIQDEEEFQGKKGNSNQVTFEDKKEAFEYAKEENRRFNWNGTEFELGVFTATPNEIGEYRKKKQVFEAPTDAYASIDEPCPSCGEIIEEITMCSVCDYRVCVDCAEDDDSGWDYDEELFDENRRSGDICPSCATMEAESKEGFSLCRSCDDSCSWLNAEGICDECEDSFNAEEFQFLNELHGQV